MMRTKMIVASLFGLSAALPGLAMAEDAAPAGATPAAAAAPAAPASPWTITANVNLVSDYYFRGISQTWHKPAVQGGFDISHSTGFYGGVWMSNVSEDTYPGGGLEFDYYGGYNGTFGDAIKDAGWTVGGYGYYYPGASFRSATVASSRADQDFNTFEMNAGLSYKWLSTKVSVDVTDWYGANTKTGYKGGTSGSYYAELNANYPLPWWDLTLVGHVAREEVSSTLTAANAASVNGKADPSYTDYKVGLSKSFKIASTEGWSVGAYYVGATNGGRTGFFGKTGWGGASYLQDHTPYDLAQGRALLTIGRVF